MKMRWDLPLLPWQEGGFTDLENLQQELEAKYRRELNRKLEEVNAYLENQARANDRLNNSHSENEARLQADKRRLEVSYNKNYN